MGVDYQAVLVVGLNADEFNRDEDGYFDSNGVLEFFSTYYDGSHGIVGVPVAVSGVYDYREVSEYVAEDIALAREKFKEASGKEGKLYISTYGW